MSNIRVFGQNKTFLINVVKTAGVTSVARARILEELCCGWVAGGHGVFMSLLTVLFL